MTDTKKQMKNKKSQGKKGTKTIFEKQNGQMKVIERERERDKREKREKKSAYFDKAFQL